MTTGGSPYVTPVPTPVTNLVSPVVDLEITITASEQVVTIADGITAKAEVYDGAIPGPTLRLTVGDTAIVRLVNNLDYKTGIHWHGVELMNSADGTPFTQDGVRGGPGTPPADPQGGTYLYYFKVTRPGLYWYHPHHDHSTNRVFRGMYGMIVVTDSNEDLLVRADGAVGAGLPPLPAEIDTLQLVLSDITVCKTVNDAATYADPTDTGVFPDPLDAPEWLSPNTTAQVGPTPLQLCETAPLDDLGDTGGSVFADGDVPNIHRNAPGRTVEGQTVLTNGVNVGGRLGEPGDPRGFVGVVHKHPVRRGQGLRLQIVNSATTRFFRLQLTDEGGTQVDLVRVGGEAGVLNEAVKEGGLAGGPTPFNFQYDAGEILLPPASRADVVAAIPAGASVGDVLTLWTRDFQRTGPGNPGNWAQLPSVPVMHLEVNSDTPDNPAYTIVGGVVDINNAFVPDGGATITKLRDSFTPPDVTVQIQYVGTANDTTLNPTFVDPGTKKGMPSPEIKLTATPGNIGIDSVQGITAVMGYYAAADHIDSARYAKLDDKLTLQVTNTTQAHHPFHLHGFSFQPVSLTRPGFPTFTWLYPEFRDNIDVPANYTLTFKVHLEDRPLHDGALPGGGNGRWLFHCHIFFHAHGGMISELVVVPDDPDPDKIGYEKPNIDVGGSWAYAPSGAQATRKGTYSHPDAPGVTVTTLGQSSGTVTDNLDGTWSWESLANGPDGIEYVFITATDSLQRKDQTVFRLKIGGGDDGSDNGDPHLRTVDGTRYDFQAAGEFTLLRDSDGMEIQTRQTPVLTAQPFTDVNSGVRSSVSVNTAVAARVGGHQVSLQPGQAPGELQFFLDWDPAQLPAEGIDLGGHRVSPHGNGGLRIDYEHLAVVTVTPVFWAQNDIWYLNVRISHTHGDEGLIGSIPDGSWLPRLSSGGTVGPMPGATHDRYVTLFQTFADSWRVKDATSLFVYEPGTSTATFTDRDWPAETHPSPLRPGLGDPQAPVAVNIAETKAEQICAAVTDPDLHRECVFDVATMGDETIADGYLAEQDHLFHGSAVQVISDKERTQPDEPLVLTAIVMPISSRGPIPTGSVTFFVDGRAAGPPVKLDRRGRARFTTNALDDGEHKIRAAYAQQTMGCLFAFLALFGGRKYSYHPSSSPNLLITVAREAEHAAV